LLNSALAGTTPPDSASAITQPDISTNPFLVCTAKALQQVVAQPLFQ
jgi:hypothetical protein